MNRGNSNKELIQFFMCPEFWVHIIGCLRFFAVKYLLSLWAVQTVDSG